MNKKIVIIVFAVLSFQVNANLKTYYDLPEGKSGQWYACFDEEGYLYGYTSLRDYGRLKGTNVLVNSVIGEDGKHKFEKLISMASAPKSDLMDSNLKWNPDNLPIWIDITKTYFIQDDSTTTKNHKCRRVEGYSNYLKVTSD